MGDPMRRAWRDVPRAPSARRTRCVLVLEDLHWGDLPTVTLRRRRAAQPARAGRSWCWRWRGPRCTRSSPRLWAERELQELRLASSRAAPRERLVRAGARRRRARRGGRAAVVERAAGNAFYLEELIRAAAEGRRRRLPETVLAMVQARLEALDARGAARAARGERLRRGVLARAASRRCSGERRAPRAGSTLLAERELISPPRGEPLPRPGRARLPPRAGARGGVRDAHRGRPRARPPARRRVARGRGRGRRGGAGRALRARRRGPRARPRATSAPPSRRSRATTSTPPSPAPSGPSPAPPTPSCAPRS